jgi:dynein heavy chain 1
MWAADIIRYETPLREIITVAVGELVLENMLNTIKNFWGEFELDLVRYQSKCKLIRGWDDLFTKLEEDLSNLSSMRISPYF